MYVKDLRTGDVSPLVESPTLWEHPVVWSHDGAHLLVAKQYGGEDGLHIWSFASRTLSPFIKSVSDVAAFSPDDRYVAFSSIESGRTEVYVTTFPERRQTWPLTTEGGHVLSWRADGREILVATLSGHIAAYPVSTEGGFTAGQPTILVRDVGILAPFSRATPDHSRILLRVSPDAAKDKGEIRLLILVLDEPSSNLDPAGRRELADILRSLEITMLMVTHNLPYALELCPRALVLTGGKIVADGKTGDILADDALIKANRLELPFGFFPSAVADVAGRG